MSADEAAVEKAKVRNNHFVYGLVSGKNAKLDDSKYVGSSRNYRVTKSTTFIDGLLSVITCGIYSPTTTTYYVQGRGAK